MDKYTEYLKIKEELCLLPYLGRRVNDAYYEFFDETNGYYPSDEYDKYPEYCGKGIIICLKPYVENGVITSISYYKKVDNGIYSRRAIEKSLTASDKKIFKELLDICTVNVAPEILKELEENDLNNGWKLVKSTLKTLTFALNGEVVKIPRAYHEKLLDYSRTYPDILDNPDCWEVNEKILKPQYRDATIAILSTLDKSKYPKIRFAETAQERIDREQKQAELKDSLKEAIGKDDTDQILSIAEELERFPREVVDYAVEKTNLDLLGKLVDKTNFKQHKDWIYYAYNKNLICVRYLLDRGLYLNIHGDKIYNINELLDLVDYPNVIWPLYYLKDLYALEDRKYIIAALKNITLQGSHPLTDGIVGYYGTDPDNIAKWLMEVGDEELIEIAKEKGVG